MSLPIVLIPGLACAAEVFASQVNALWPLGPVTIASTLDGDTMATIAASILAAAPPRFALAAISMGGYIAFEILRQAPERVEKLALLDTSARPDTAEATALRRAMIVRLQSGEIDAVMDDAFPALVHPSHKDDAALQALNRRMARTIGAKAFERQQEAIIGRPDSRPILATIRQPTLMLVGDSDFLTPPHLAREIATAIPGAELVVIPEAGHMSPNEQPARVNAELVRWLAA